MQKKKKIKDDKNSVRKSDFVYKFAYLHAHEMNNLYYS